MSTNGVNGTGDATTTGSTCPERKWERPDRVSRCTWVLGKSKPEDSPHFHTKRYVGINKSQSQNLICAMY